MDNRDFNALMGKIQDANHSLADLILSPRIEELGEGARKLVIGELRELTHRIQVAAAIVGHPVEELELLVYDKSITGHDSEHRKLRAAVTRAMDDGITTNLVVHRRRGAAIVPVPQGR